MAAAVKSAAPSGRDAVQTYYSSKIEELEVEVRERMLNLRRLEAQRNELNSKVRLLREELSLLQEPGSYVGEVVKVMGRKKVLVKVILSPLCLGGRCARHPSPPRSFAASQAAETGAPPHPPRPPLRAGSSRGQVRRRRRQDHRHRDAQAQRPRGESLPPRPLRHRVITAAHAAV